MAEPTRLVRLQDSAVTRTELVAPVRPAHFTVNHEAIADLVLARMNEAGHTVTTEEPLVREAVSETLRVLHL